MSAARARLPEGDSTMTRWLRPVSARVHRAAQMLEASPLRDRERELRSALETDPVDSELWWQLGLCLAAQRRYDETVEAWFRSAECGELLRVVHEFQARELVWEMVGSPGSISRMRRIAERAPESAEAQSLIGVFLLDQGRLEEGRSLVRRGYELQYEAERPEVLSHLTESGSLAPSFFIIGPHKSGTTTLHSLLGQHPRVLGTPRKELRFWGRERGRAPEAYEAYFPPVESRAGYTTGESSPNYLQVPEAAAAVADRYPAAKAIVLHRDPVARAYSHYQMLRRLQIESRTFEECVEVELAVIGATPPIHLREAPTEHLPYLLGSCLLPYLEMWTEALGPERVMVVESSYLSKDRQGTLNQLHTYLGLEQSVLGDETDRNVGEYEPIDPRTAARLGEWFAPHEAALDEFLSHHPARIPPDVVA